MEWKERRNGMVERRDGGEREKEAKEERNRENLNY